MPTESEWHDIVEAAYTEISPREDPAITVHSIEMVNESTCTAVVNGAGGAGMVSGYEVVKVDGNLVSLEEIQGTGLGEQKVEVKL